MDFFEKLGETVTSKSREVASKAREMTDTVSLSVELHEKENYLEKQYFDIGVLYFQRHKEDECQEFEQMERILQIQEECRKLRDEIAKRKGKVTCQSCGEFVEKEFRYCPHCGGFMEFTEDAAE